MNIALQMDRAAERARDEEVERHFSDPDQPPARSELLRDMGEDEFSFDMGSIMLDELPLPVAEIKEMLVSALESAEQSTGGLSSNQKTIAQQIGMAILDSAWDRMGSYQ